jgi:tyrosine-protein phosphatase YwqE
LPGIDDGAKDINDTKKLIQELKEIGFKQLITTPHIINGVWENTSESILLSLNETNKQLDFPIKAAAEYMLDSNFYDRLKKDEKLLTIKDNYILIEMSYLSAPIQLYDIIFEIHLQGYKPILAHPERYLFYGSKFEEFKKIKKSGCLLQLNLLATTGYYGAAVTKIADQLIKENLYDFVGSDVHHYKHVESLKTKLVIKNHQLLESIIKNNKIFEY